jgi:hypothetical protein
MAVVSYLIVVGVIFGALFLTAYVTGRRLGILGLALAAGSVVASFWVGEVTPLVAQAGVEIIRPPLSTLVAVALILLPPVLLFFNGPSVKQRLLRLVGAVLFAMLAVAFLLEPLDAALLLDSTSKPIHELLVHYRPFVITGGLTLSVLDLMLGRKLGHERASRH